MPKFLSKDTDFIVLQTAMLETLSTKYDPTYTGTYLLKGIDNHIIKCVPFESRYLNIVERVNDFLKETKDNSILVVLGDAEIFNPLELDHQLKEILKINGYRLVLFFMFLIIHFPPCSFTKIKFSPIFTPIDICPHTFV